MAARVDLRLSGFRELKGILAPGRFQRRLRKHIRKATKKNALIAEAAIKIGITAGKFERNSPLTAAMKGSGRPLVDTGELLKSINGRALSWDEAAIGVLKSRIVRDKDTNRPKDILQIAQILHNGATVDVTPRMRRFFGKMARLYSRGETRRPWRPIASRTKVIVIPKRPFLRSATTSGIIRKYKSNWQAAVQQSMVGG